MDKKIVLITGANKGIGFEVARQLGKSGKHILLGVRNKVKGEEARKVLQNEGISCDVLEVDVTNESSIQDAKKQVEAKYGVLDVLVNNAGVFPEFGKQLFEVEKLPSLVLTDTYTTNVFGPVMMIHHFLPLIKKSKAGRIVNVSSSAGSLTDQSNPESPYYGMNTLAYNSSKASLNMVTVQVAKQLADTNVKINSVCPGWVRTDMGTEAAPRSVSEGAGIIVKMANLPEEENTNGVFVDDSGSIPW